MFSSNDFFFRFYRRTIRYSRVCALTVQISVIPAQAGIYNPVSAGILDTRLRGYDEEMV
jgi:hypothetical protein